MTRLDTAATLSDDMAALLAKANGLRQSDNSLKILRDKGHTSLYHKHTRKASKKELAKKNK